jgi:hypothetical protein
MDVLPENISQDIIEIARRNPKIKEIVNLYLHEIPIREDQPLSWRDALELIVKKLDEQYEGALQGWKEDLSKAKASESTALTVKK